MSLMSLLKADAKRNLLYSGRGEREVSALGVLRMALSPRFLPVVLYRLAYWFGTHGMGPIGKLFSLMNFVVFGMEIGVTTEIGPGVYFPHTLGTVIGARRIGKNAVIYHQVTLGAKTPDGLYTPELRPEVGNDVFIGSGAKVLGGIILGDGCVIAANAVVVKSVPERTIVGGVPAKVIGSTDADRAEAAASDRSC